MGFTTEQDEISKTWHIRSNTDEREYLQIRSFPHHGHMHVGGTFKFDDNDLACLREAFRALQPFWVKHKTQILVCPDNFHADSNVIGIFKSVAGEFGIADIEFFGPLKNLAKIWESRHS